MEMETAVVAEPALRDSRMAFRLRKFRASQPARLPLQKMVLTENRTDL
jgi:hypothetical protein